MVCRSFKIVETCLQIFDFPKIIKLHAFQSFRILFTFFLKAWLFCPQEFENLFDASKVLFHFMMMTSALIGVSCFDKVSQRLENLPMPPGFLFSEFIMELGQECKVFGIFFVSPMASLIFIRQGTVAILRRRPERALGKLRCEGQSIGAIWHIFLGQYWHHLNQQSQNKVRYIAYSEMSVTKKLVSYQFIFNIIQSDSFKQYQQKSAYSQSLQLGKNQFVCLNDIDTLNRNLIMLIELQNE